MNAETVAADDGPRRDEVRLSGDNVEAALRRLCHHHALISVRRLGSLRKQLSVILHVDSARGLMLLDAPHPAASPDFAADEIIKLHTRLDGADALFEARAIGMQRYEGSAALALRLPPAMRVRERRATHRLPLPPSLPRSPSQADTGAAKLPLNLVDISLRGAGATTALPKAAVTIGDTVHLDLELPGAQILALAEVRTHAVYGDKLRLGLRFVSMEPQELDRLAATLLRLERQLLRDYRAH